MRTKNAKAITKAEHAYLDRIKNMPCVVCNAPPVSDAHHLQQGQHYTAIPLCRSCHQDGFNGIHGQARIWKAQKMDEMSCLNETIRFIAGGQA